MYDCLIKVLVVYLTVSIKENNFTWQMSQDQLKRAALIIEPELELLSSCFDLQSSLLIH